VKSIAGPFQVGVEFGLSCEVRGGNPPSCRFALSDHHWIRSGGGGRAGSRLKFAIDYLDTWPLQLPFMSAIVPATPVFVNATVLSMIYNAFHK